MFFNAENIDFDGIFINYSKSSITTKLPGGPTSDNFTSTKNQWYILQIRKGKIFNQQVWYIQQWTKQGEMRN